ncbi:MAG: metalloregulator ArsR/SmtB family transcription factor, partial [Nitriliruptorales bacterium]|nr:metalloregulator ArsR/SmtB family transcription factor [Nitriliruptorales bacterium]
VTVRFRAGAVTEGVIGLASAARGAPPAWCGEGLLPLEVTAALDAVGDPTGEVWFHLLGLVIESEDRVAPRQFVRKVAALDPVELLRHVLGVHVPAWRECVATEDLEAAARGDADAALGLLGSEHYYGGHASEALATLLGVGPEEARHRLVAALERWFDDVVAPRLDRLEELHASVDHEPLDDEDPLDTVARVTGFRFEPEDYTEEVILVPQFAGRQGTVLAQHGGARIIAYDASDQLRDELAVLAEVFAALGEVSRLELLQHLADEPGGVSDLARAIGLAKSTTHQHLAVLKDAGVIALAGQAWRYRYEVRPERIRSAAAQLLQLLSGAEGSPTDGT